MRYSPVAVIFFLFSLSLHAQWDCRSILGAHLHPIIKKQSPFSAGLELTTSQGWMNDRRINNLMVFPGMNLQIGKQHSLYAEGGFKGWNYVVMNHDIPAGKPDNFSKKRMGIREGFYKYSGLNSTLTIGFQSITASDLWLVNERGLGVKYNQSFGKYGFDFSTATVVRDFSRMGSYCTVKYIYNLVKKREDAYIGNQPGETNFSGLVWWFDPDGKKNSKPETVTETEDEFKPLSTGDDEFKPLNNNGNEFKSINGDDEFKTMNDGKEALPFFTLSRHGFVLYSEYGSRIANPRFFYGYMLNADLFKKLRFKTQVLHQNDKNNGMLIATGGLEYMHSWPSSHLTAIGLNNYYSVPFTDNSRVSASFTNFFIGEVLRMESQDMPLSQFYVKHTFPGKKKVYVKAQHVMQYQNNHMAESDAEAGLKAFGHFRLTGIVSRITARSLNEPYYMFRIELRMAI
jgi:hypothetical protein